MPAVQASCPQCNSKLTYIVSTTQDNNGHLIRRRRCDSCKHRWYTLQYPEVEISKYQLAWKGKKPFLKQPINEQTQKDYSISTRGSRI